MRFGFGDSQVSTDLLHRHWTASHRATIDVSQPLIQDNSAQYYTTVTQKIDTDHCAKLVGICCDYAQREISPFFLTNLLRAIDQSHSAPSAPEGPARDVFCPFTAKKSAGD